MNNSIVILYASQTGNAQRIAEEIYDAAPNFGLKPYLYCVSLIDKRFILRDISCMIAVVSTSGDGEPPDTAVKFYRRLSRRILPSDYLSHINYALLALGDSTYIKFCKFGRAVDERFQKLGAHKFYDTGYADDRRNYDEIVYFWIFNLWSALRKHLDLPPISPLKIGAIFSLNSTTAKKMEEKEQETSKHSKEQETFEHSKKPSFTQRVSVPSDISIYDLPSVVAKLPQISLNTPSLPDPYLSIVHGCTLYARNISPGRLSFAGDSDVVRARIMSAERLTTFDDSTVKKTLELFVRFEDDKVPFAPGDAFGFMCENCPTEVECLFDRLGVSRVADCICFIELLKDLPPGKKIPAHLPINASLRSIFSNCVDFRAVPKKVLLRILANYTTDESERLSLELLSSHEGMALFKECIQKPSLSLLHLLEIFPSCCPPVARLLEHLPCLRPRFYSAASSPLVCDQEFRIVFNIIEMERKRSRIKKNYNGICSGWLNDITEQMQSVPCETIGCLDLHTSRLVIYDRKTVHIPRVLIYKRNKHHFSLPDDVSLPLIMIGPGTGVAPFLGFLQHREKQLANSNSDAVFGETWLFYGCRYKEKDFLYRQELQRLQSCNILKHLIVCFSRDKDHRKFSHPRYVQDNIKLYSTQLVNAVDNGAIIYVCGDAKKMSKDVLNTFGEIFKTSKGFSEEELDSYLKKLHKEKRYRVDVWA